MKTARAAAIVSIVLFALYRATLLPGVDFGDTAFFQTTVGSPLLTARNAYPLYFAIGRAWVRLTGLAPARALNLASAVEGAIAGGLLVFVGAELSGSIAAGAVAALLFGVSYTFWSQAIIAEVYALHAIFVALSLLLVLRWQRRPTPGRIAIFFAVYALGFGNHLSMILLAPACTIFLLVAGRDGWRSVVNPRVIALAILCAAAGALQYLPALRGLWLQPDPPAGLLDGLRTFWFDVTKSDWRDTMVFNVPQSMLADHAAMYWFDLRQQFGSVVPALAALGLFHLGRRDWRRALLLGVAYLVNVAFAFSYNVGDSHVFYLPSHLMVTLLAGVGVTATAALRPWTATAAAATLALYASARAYRDFPALDRSGDTRPGDLLRAFTADVDDRRAILLVDMNWQIQNGLSYHANVTQPAIAYDAMPDVLLYAPALVADNRGIDRDVIVSERGRRAIADLYGPLFDVTRDVRATAPSLSDAVRDVPPGTRYVLCVLEPSRDLALDRDELARAIAALTGGADVHLPSRDYVALAGIVGAPPAVVAADDRPFSRRGTVAGVDTEIRMESWLAADTIRRMGFGQVVAARRHTLIVERGISFAAFDADGRPTRTAYASNIFAPQPRYLIGMHRD